MVDVRIAIALTLGCAVACGKSGRDDGAEGGGAGEVQAGSAGVSGSGTGGRAGGGNGGAGGEDAGAPGSGGEAGSAGSDGEAGSAGQAGAGGASAGAGGVTPVVDPVPPPDSTWDLPTGDPLNSTPPVLAPLGDGVVIAGSTSDPRLAGLESFAGDATSEAFVAALDRDGQPRWSTALLDAGMPQAIAVAPGGDIVVVAANLPDATLVSPGFYGDQTLIARLSPDGDLHYARAVDFESAVLSVAVAPGGDIYVAGGEISPNGVDTASVLLARYDAEASEIWLERYPHAGSSALAEAVAVTAGGDVVITGYFNGSLSFGGETLTTLASLDQFLMPNGFLARFSADGDHVRSQRFGGTVFDGGTRLHALTSGDLLLGGFLSGSATLAGRKVVAGEDGSPFLARLDDTDQALWVSLAGTGSARALAVDPGESLFHLAGDLGPGRWFAEFRADGALALNAPRPPGESFFTTSLAVDSALGLWLSGGFMGSADFGNGNLLSSDGAGVYLVRLERE